MQVVLPLEMGCGAGGRRSAVLRSPASTDENDEVTPWPFLTAMRNEGEGGIASQQSNTNRPALCPTIACLLVEVVMKQGKPPSICLSKVDLDLIWTALCHKTDEMVIEKKRVSQLCS